MRKKKVYFSAVAIAAAIASCTTGQGDKIIIEGELANVPDSLVMELIEWEGASGEKVATDTLIDGKFRFEIESASDGLSRGMICSDGGLRTPEFLWIEPGAKVEIAGDGLDYSGWEIRSNVDAQENENLFREAAKSEHSQMFQCVAEYLTMLEAFNNKNVRTDEESKLMITRLRELSERQENIYKEISHKERTLLADMNPDEAWAYRLSTLCTLFEHYDDSIAGIVAKEQFGRMDEQLEASFYGQKIKSALFPPAVLQIGDMVPDIELKDTLGNVHSLQELRGKYVLLDFWSRGCGPCIMSFPELRELSEKMKDWLEVVSISQDAESAWRKASAKHGITWNNWNDLQFDSGIFARFGVQGIPRYFIISPEGKLVDTKEGYSEGFLKYNWLPKYMDLYGRTPSYRNEGDVRIIDYPEVDEDHLSCMNICRVELSEKGTDVIFKVLFRPGWWIKVADTSYIVADCGEKLPIRKATGITLNAETYVPESGVMEFTLHFPALPVGCTSFSYYETEEADAWRAIGVKVKE